MLYDDILNELKIGTASIENALLKYGAKDHFFRAGLCHLCIDHLNCQQAIARYESILAAFTDSREANFLKQLAQSVDENNVENFTNTVKDYDNMSRLDNWCTTLLLRVKKTMNEEPDLK
jgi:alpha-soluble NSF attachment protein